jgi:hypothetical protein
MSTLLVYHYHFRPGGVRSVIERGLIEWCLQGEWVRVVLVSGEAPPSDWTKALADRLPGVCLEISADSRMGYLSEQVPRSGFFQEVREKIWNLVGKIQPNLIWAHNLSLGRNLIVGEALGEICAEKGVRLLCHHHDWWLQHRWERWSEMVAWGFETLGRVAGASFPTGPLVRHAVVHPQDAQVLGNAVTWVQNPVPRPTEMVVPPAEQDRVNALLGTLRYWLVPARVLRRKNLLEAVILQRLLAPEVTTLLVAGPASPTEEAYAKAVVAGAATVGIEVRLGVSPTTGLSVPALMWGAEMVLQTSVQEGFGLTALEASQQGKPLILRRLPFVTDWLEGMGGTFPQSYHQVNLPTSAVPAEEAGRWQENWQARCAFLPPAWRTAAEATGTANFSHFAGLSLQGQLAVLESFDALEPALRLANPLLETWRLNPPPPSTAPSCPNDWPQQMERLWEQAPTPAGTSLARLEELFQAHLREAACWPLLW